MPIQLKDLPIITAEKIRRVFSTIMGRVSYGHTPYLVTNRGIPSMVLIGADDFKDLINLIDKMSDQLNPEVRKRLIKSYIKIKKDGVEKENVLNNIIIKQKLKT